MTMVRVIVQGAFPYNLPPSECFCQMGSEWEQQLHKNFKENFEKNEKLNQNK